MRIVKGARRYRYIRFCVTYHGSERQETKEALLSSLRRHTVDLFSLRLQDLGLWLLYWDGAVGIIKCRHREKDRTIRLLQSMTAIQDTPVQIITTGTSGTLRSLQTVHQDSFVYHQ
ncbi:MAG: Rpp14/Pop5 family protein [Candidatus Thermoplasmatota archaeon]|nr:Rpp14/Pop5 family protein [Candidatus Thermoplasmatota archaeon]